MTLADMTATAPADPIGDGSAPDRRLLSGLTLNIRGRRVRLHRRGYGHPVLLLHGNGSLGQEILSLCPDVPGVQWIAPDRPGYGQSAAPDSWDPPAGADWTAELIEHLGLKRVTLVAHSIAAAQAMVCAAQRPDLVKALILLAPFCRLSRDNLNETCASIWMRFYVAASERLSGGLFLARSGSSAD